MNQKNIIKRKPSITISTPIPIGNSSAGSYGSEMTQYLPVRPPRIGAVIHPNHPNLKPSSER
jgi:hypothetical protein